MAQIHVTATEITEDFVALEGVDIGKIALAEDLFAQFDEEPVVRFVFDRKAKNAGPLKYLYKVIAGTKSCNKGKSFGEKIELLKGNFLIISDSFIVS